MTNLHEAIRAADQFLRWARLHQDAPRPEMLEKCRVELIEALGKMEIPPPATKDRERSSGSL